MRGRGRGRRGRFGQQDRWADDQQRHSDLPQPNSCEASSKPTQSTVPPYCRPAQKRPPQAEENHGKDSSSDVGDASPSSAKKIKAESVQCVSVFYVGFMTSCPMCN